MENALTIFKNGEFGEVRTLLINDEPCFMGKDVCNVLGFKNTKDALKNHVDFEDKIDGVAICDPIGREQKATFINESGLYSLIFRSKLESAKRFKRWVTSEVLPAIRKTGSYNKTPALPQNYTEALEQLLIQVKKNEEQEQLIAKQQHDLERSEKIVNYSLDVLNSTDTLTITQIAKDYGMSGKELNAFLGYLGVQYKQNGQWLLYSKYQGKGYARSETVRIETEKGIKTKMNTKWTQKGRAFIYGQLKKLGFTPKGETEAIEEVKK